MKERTPITKKKKRIIACVVIIAIIIAIILALPVLSPSPKVYNAEDGLRYVEIGSINDRPIQWIILDEQPDGRKLVISRFVLYADTYNASLDKVTWETCGLRKYLNSDFYNKVYSPFEKMHIEKTRVAGNDNPRFGTEGGKDTKDKLFLLSLEEVHEYFLFETWDDEKWTGTSRALDTKPLGSAGMENYLTWEGESPGSIDNSSSWWLRTPGSIDNRYACIVDAGGSIRQTQTVNEMYGVRPVMWIK